MLSGKVIGRVWSTKKLEQLPAGALLEIELDYKAGTIIAFDPLGCGDGERILLSTGSIVDNYFTGASSLIDAIIIASLEEPSSKLKPKKQP